MRSLALASLLLLAGLGCQQRQAPPAPGVPSSAASVAAAPRVAKVVFIDQENACECTKKRIEGSWTALQFALGAPPTLPVQRIHLDTEGAKAEAYTALEPLMVPPGVYFVDDRDAVVEFLQGEVSREQIVAVLERR